MSDGILSGLRSVTRPLYGQDERGDVYPMTNAITWVKRDDVREALRSDKWKRLIAADLCEHEGVGKACIDCTFKAESVQELLTGGDQ